MEDIPLFLSSHLLCYFRNVGRILINRSDGAKVIVNVSFSIRFFKRALPSVFKSFQIGIIAESKNIRIEECLEMNKSRLSIEFL